MLKFCLALGLLLLAYELPPVSQAQNESVLSRESDESARTRDEREQALSILLEAAQQVHDSDPAKAAGFLNRAARLQFRLSRSQEALASYQSALTILDRVAEPTIRIEALNGLAFVIAQSGHCDQSQKYIDEALSLSDQHQNVSGRAEALWNLSDCQGLKKQDLALENIAESLRLFESVGNKKGMARAYMLQGDFQTVRSDLIEATKSNEAALNIWRELGIPDEEAGALINLGFIQYRKGFWQECLTSMTQAQGLLDEPSEPFRMAQIYSGVAESFMEIGLPDAGLENATKALAAFQRAEDARGVAVTMWDIGKAYYLLDQKTEAITWLEDAKKNAQAIEYPRIVAFSDDFLGRTYLANGEPDRALESLQLALTSYTQLQYSREAARTQVLIAVIYESQGKVAKAGSLLRDAAAEFGKLSDRVNEAVAVFALGKHELRLNNLDRAEEYLRRSIEITEQIRSVTRSVDLTTAMSATVSDRYDSYIDCLMRKHAKHPDAGFAARAFEMSELARARTLAELLRARQTGLASLDPKLAAQQKSLLQSLQVKQDAKIALLGTSYDQKALNTLDGELNNIEAQYQQVLGVIKNRYPAYQQMIQPDALSMREIQTKVLNDDQSLLLEYALGDEHSYLWVVSKNELSSYELPGRKEIENAARGLYSSLTAAQPKTDETFQQRQERMRNAEAALPQQISELSKLLLGPVADKLGKKRLIVVADGALQYIPFQVLTLGFAANKDSTVAREMPVPLLVDHEIINEPSASTLALLLNDSTDRSRAVGSVAIVADPVFEADDVRLSKASTAESAKRLGGSVKDEVSRVFRDVGQPVDNRRIPRLLASREEAEAIMSVVPWRTGYKALDFDASRATLSTPDFGQYRILHFATHTMINNEHPELSGILLSLVDSQGRPENGFLRMSDIYDLKLSSNLVVLSACSTALGKEVRGEGLIGLTRGFLYAGASGVASSLWRVDDEATAELMKHFYEGMFQRGLTPSASLREAQLAMWNEKRWRAPYYWASFVIQGRYNQTENSDPPTWRSAEKIAFIGIMTLFLLTTLTLLIRRKKRANSLGGMVISETNEQKLGSDSRTV